MTSNAFLRLEKRKQTYHSQYQTSMSLLLWEMPQLLKKNLGLGELMLFYETDFVVKISL